jgi:hypothetical protein
LGSAQIWLSTLLLILKLPKKFNFPLENITTQIEFFFFNFIYKTAHEVTKILKKKFRNFFKIWKLFCKLLFCRVGNRKAGSVLGSVLLKILGSGSGLGSLIWVPVPIFSRTGFSVRFWVLKYNSNFTKKKCNLYNL